MTEWVDVGYVDPYDEMEVHVRWDGSQDLINKVTGEVKNDVEIENNTDLPWTSRELWYRVKLYEIVRDWGHRD